MGSKHSAAKALQRQHARGVDRRAPPKQISKEALGENVPVQSPAATVQREEAGKGLSKPKTAEPTRVYSSLQEARQAEIEELTTLAEVTGLEPAVEAMELYLTPLRASAPAEVCINEKSDDASVNRATDAFANCINKALVDRGDGVDLNAV